MGFPYLDPLAGIVVAGLIVKIGATSTWESLKVKNIFTENSVKFHIF